MADIKTKKRSSLSTPVHHNTNKWIEENKQFFLPPVCNKMMHNDGQLKVFYVGGPNARKDFHIEEGEELFYMVKGDMVLKIVEKGKHRDISIKEGQLFLLPGRIPHSPQRKADTIGLMLERDRPEDEKDGLRYYQEINGKLTTDILYEEWFHCEDLGTQLPPVINKFFESEQYKTGKPIPGTILEKPPVTINSEISVEDPFHLKTWIAENRTMLDQDGSIPVFGDPYQFQVTVYGEGSNTDKCDDAEVFIWQVEGKSTVSVEGKEFTLEENDTLLVRAGQKYKAKRPEGSVSVICFQDPSRKYMTE